MVYTKTINSRRFKVNNILTFGHKYIYSGDERSKYNMMCEEMIKDIVQKVSIVPFMTIFSYGLFGIIPFYLIVFRKFHVSLMGLEVPFCESDSDIGFAVNLLGQSILAMLS